MLQRLQEEIKLKSEEILPKIKEYRTHLHMNPELSFQEFETANFIASKLEIPEALDSIIYCPGTINLKPFNRYTEDELIDDFKINVLGFLKILSAFH